MSSEQIEARIAELEAQVARLDASLGDPDVWKDAVRAARLTDERAELKSALSALEEEWLGRL